MSAPQGAARGRVLLINPRITSRRHARFPLSIMSLAAALESRYDATLIDGNLDHDAARSACDAMKKERFDAVGVTVMGGPQVATAIDVSRAVRRARPDLPIVWGGYFPRLRSIATMWTSSRAVRARTRSVSCSARCT
jgi:anaerobic magnesium-protoporphyrin IX monomethyl ester cyclase